MKEKIGVIQFMTDASSRQKTGCLNIYNDNASWRIYFENGDLKYAESSIFPLSQLQYCFLKNNWNQASDALKSIPKEILLKESRDEEKRLVKSPYEVAIQWLYQRDHLDISMLHRLIEEISQNTIEQAMWLKGGQVSWEEASLYPKWIYPGSQNSSPLDIAETMRFLQSRFKSWQSCASDLVSPHQRPYILDYRDIEKNVPSGTLTPNKLSKLSNLMRQGLSLRQLSLYLKHDELHIAQLLSPYIQDKVIHLRPPQPPFNLLPQIYRVSKPNPEPQISNKVHKIVCIDDSVYILQEMTRFLEGDRFDLTTINDPIQASSMIFRIKPDMILMDITMPKINGYRLCSLLRSSGVFDDTPIIMVSGNTGLIDKARAKLSGATDYITKPFTKEEILAMMQQYLNSA